LILGDKVYGMATSKHKSENIMFESILEGKKLRFLQFSNVKGNFQVYSVIFHLPSILKKIFSTQNLPGLAVHAIC
jgi:hypothetical protein